MLMKKITLTLFACLLAVAAYAAGDVTSKIEMLKANSQATVKAEGETPTTPPEGIEGMIYTLHGLDTYVDRYKDSEVLIIKDGDDVYIKGLSIDYMPDGWVKGTLANNVLTIPAQYMGIFSFWGDDYNLYFDGAEFTYDPEADTYISGAEAGYTTSAEETVLDEYVDVTIAPVEVVAATPANPEITAFERDNYGFYAKLNIPLKDVEGNDLLASFMYYQMYVDVDGEVTPYVLTEDNYVFLGVESMSEVPYNFTDSYDVDVAGKQVYLYGDNMRQWDRFGVQSIYLGGNERNVSDIVWLDVAPIVGINAVTTGAQVESVNYYDLMGRPVTATTGGIVIKQEHMSDGSVKTSKVLNK